MLTTQELNSVIGRNAYSPEGDKIGKVGNVYVDDLTAEPTFVTVQTGLFGTHERFVPLQEAQLDGDQVKLPFSKDKVKDAPHVDAAEGHLDPTEERRIFDYYGLPYDVTPQHFTETGTAGQATPPPAASPSAAAPAAPTPSAPTPSAQTTTGEPDEAMTRSEESLAVGTRTAETGRARLRKYVETEHVTQTVPVRKDCAVVEREPITDENVDRSLSEELREEHIEVEGADDPERL